MNVVRRSRRAQAAASADATRMARAAESKYQRWLDRHPRLRPVDRIIREVIWIQSRDRCTLAAAGTGFWLVVSLFPAAIAAVSVFGLVIQPEQVIELIGNLAQHGPGTFGQTLSTELAKVAQTDSTSLSISLVVSLLFSLWSVSAGTYSLARAIQLSYGLPPPNYIKLRARSLVSAAVSVVALVLVAAGVTVATLLNDRVDGFAQLLVSLVIEIPIGLALVMLTIMGNYRYAIGRRTGFWALVPGAAFATVCIGGIGIWVSYFFGGLGRYSAVYGAATGIVVSLFLAYICVYVILLGAIINARLADPRPLDLTQPRVREGATIRRVPPPDAA